MIIPPCHFLKDSHTFSHPCSFLHHHTLPPLSVSVGSFWSVHLHLSHPLCDPLLPPSSRVILPPPMALNSPSVLRTPECTSSVWDWTIWAEHASQNSFQPPTCTLRPVLLLLAPSTSGHSSKKSRNHLWFPSSNITCIQCLSTFWWFYFQRIYGVCLLSICFSRALTEAPSSLVGLFRLLLFSCWVVSDSLQPRGL